MRRNPCMVFGSLKAALLYRAQTISQATFLAVFLTVSIACGQCSTANDSPAPKQSALPWALQRTSSLDLADQEFHRLEVKLGDVEARARIPINIRLYSSTSQVASVKKVSVSCGCVNAKIVGSTHVVGSQNPHLFLTYAAAMSDTEIRQSATLSFILDGVNRKLEIVITGKVKGLFSLSRGLSRVLFDVAESNVFTEVLLTANFGRKFRDIKVEAARGQLSVVSELTSPTVARISIRPSKEVSESKASGADILRIELTLDDGSVVKFEDHVFYKFVKEVVVSPPIVLGDSLLSGKWFTIATREASIPEDVRVVISKNADEDRPFEEVAVGSVRILGDHALRVFIKANKRNEDVAAGKYVFNLELRRIDESAAYKKACSFEAVVR